MNESGQRKKRERGRQELRARKPVAKKEKGWRASMVIICILEMMPGKCLSADYNGIIGFE